MKETIQYLATLADEWKAKAKETRQSGDHILATRQEKRAKNLAIIIKLAQAVYPK